ncbi:MAG TPA: hypothetical protein VNE39_22300 [Planctomycetota bacterium]|nr:hypothetical protein [Planctomycetota bacterium]
MDEKPLFYHSLEAGSRVYEFEVRRASTGAKYLVIKEVQQVDEEPRVRGMIMVFEDHLLGFRRAARAAMQVLRKTRAEQRPTDVAQKSYDLASIRRNYPRAYEKWTPEEEAHLRELAARGSSIRELAAQIQRQPGAIRSRLDRMGFPMPT